jgi:hypothetical protein
LRLESARLIAEEKPVRDRLVFHSARIGDDKNRLSIRRERPQHPLGHTVSPAIHGRHGHDRREVRRISGGFFFRGVDDASGEKEREEREEGSGKREAGRGKRGAGSGNGEIEGI